MKSKLGCGILILLHLVIIVGLCYYFFNNYDDDSWGITWVLRIAAVFCLVDLSYSK